MSAFFVPFFFFFFELLLLFIFEMLVLLSSAFSKYWRRFPPLNSFERRVLDEFLRDIFFFDLGNERSARVESTVDLPELSAETPPPPYLGLMEKWSDFI
jgi:hypothetical protein